MIRLRRLLLAACCIFVLVPPGAVRAEGPTTPERQAPAAASGPAVTQGAAITLAVLSKPADLVVPASFMESPSGDVAFEQTPITLTLGVKRRTKSTRHTSLSFTLTEMKKLTSELRSALPASGVASGGTPAPDDGISRRLEAARLMAKLKHLPYIAPLEDHRRQIELAQRVIYLDPSAKEAHYRLGISLDALTRSTWHRGGSHEGSSKDTADALSKYLQFPRTNAEHVRWAFSYLSAHLSVLNKESPQKNLAILTEYICWRHKQDPINPPVWTCWPSYYFNDWWRRHPQERLEFYLWIDRLYEKKKHLSVFPFRIAYAYDQLKEHEKAAEYLYDGLVSHRLAQIQLNSAVGGEVGGWWQSCRPRELAKLLDEKRSSELLTRLNGATEKRGTGLYRADRKRIGKLQCQTVQPEAVPLGRTLVQSVIVRQTKAGLWMQGGTTDGTMVLLFSEDGRSWRAMKTPEQMTKIRGYANLAESENHVVSIVQLGDEVLFATLRAGLFVYDSQKDVWREYGSKEGLPAQSIAQMTASADGKSAWIAGGGFLCRYQDGKIFLPKAKIDLFPDSLASCGDRLLMICDGQLLAVKPESGSKTVLLTRLQQQGLLPVPPIFYGPTGSTMPASIPGGDCSWLARRSVLSVTDWL